MIEKKPITSDNEHKRLAALRSYDILDTLPEKEYDAITRLASYICQAPIALITLIDAEREWAKSTVGIEFEQAPRDEVLCNHTILSDNVLEIPDALADDTYNSNPSVKGGLGVRYYAGAPIIDPDGQRIGALCVVDTVPRKLTPEQLEAMRTLADEVMSHLVLRKQKRELEEALYIHKDFYALFNSSPLIHFIANKDANIQLVNKAVVDVLGYTPQQVIGHSLWEFVAGNNRQQFASVIDKGKETHTSFDIETETVATDGNIKWISWCAVNRANKWYVSGRDITYQKKIQDEVELLSLVASKMINGVAISNADDEVVWINNAFERITGYNLSDVKNKHLRATLKGKPNPETIKQLEEAIARKISYEIELLVTRKNGEQMWVTIINTVVYDAEGNVEKYIRIIIDITERKNAEKDVEILSFAARKTTTGMLIRDKEGIIIWMNEAMEHIVGYTLTEMKGKTFGKTLIGPDTDVQVMEEAVNAVKENRPYEVELKIYRKDGTHLWVSISNNPLINDVGEVERQIGVFVDINERKNAEQQLKLLSLVASSTTSGVVINDREGKVEWVNSAFEKITGYTIDDVKARHLGDTLKGELTDVGIIERAHSLSRNKQSFEVDLLAYRKDGQPLWLSVINSVIVDQDGEIDRYIEVIIDITAKKKVELELISAKEEALQLNRAKDMFISVMSHEIRTPLNAVIGMSHLLMDDHPSESQMENLGILKFSAENLMTLINDVLDFTKIETGNVELEKANVNLREMVQSIINSMQYKAIEKNVYLRHTIDDALPKLVIADSARLVQVLLNLTGNALKFTETGGVTIDLKVLEESKNNVRVRFAVTDTGIGIASDKINTIFESFKQAEADTTRKYGGTGLGLAISKRLIELHDSRVNVDSVLGQGSTFWFTITFNKADNVSISKDSKMEIGLRLSVLVVDDNQINRILVNKVLQKWGAQVDFAENGQEAIDKIEEFRSYDVVLMDVHMPIMGGLEATRILRAREDVYLQQLPIVALTASMLSTEVNQMTSAGMNDFILKPFDPKSLYEKLARYQK